TNFYQHFEYTAITNVVSKYYEVSGLSVNFTAVLFYSNPLIVVYPLIYCLKKHGLQATALVAIFLNAIGPCIKCLALHRNLYWLLLIGQSFPAFVTITQPGITAIFGANWFNSEHVAMVIGTETIFFVLGSIFAFLSPTMIFNEMKNEEDIVNGLSLISTTLAILTSILFVISALVIREKPPTPPCLAEKNRENNMTDQSLKVLINNRSYLVLTIIFCLVAASSRTLSVVLNQSIFLQFSNANHIVTIAGILSLIPGLLSSTFTGLYILSLKLKCELCVYITIFITGFCLIGTYVLALDFIIEVTYPFPEAIAVNITNLCMCIPSIFILPLTSSLISSFGATYGNLALFAITFINFILSLFIKEDLRRHKANTETTSLLYNTD
ncbi:feline leukemia virus subgroup C receptor-related protein 1-like protein, partial [Dinothrombium tinctorium]